MVRPLRVFLSLTTELREHPADLSWYAAARKAIELRGHVPVDMWKFGSDHRPPPEVCRDRVVDSDVWVGIIGHRYGSCIPESNVSFTEMEFDTATEEKKRRIALVLSDDAPVARRDPERDSGRQQAFRDKIRDDVTATKLRTPVELLGELILALERLEKEPFPARMLPPAPPPVVPSPLRDRHDTRAEVRRVLERRQDRVVVLHGSNGSGKTAVVSQLLTELQQVGPPTPFRTLQYLSATGHISVTGIELLRRLVRAVPSDDRRERLLDRLRLGPWNGYDLVQEVLDAHTGDLLVVLDQLEELLDDEDLFVDRYLGQLVAHLSSRDDHHVSLLLVGARRPSSVLIGYRRQATIGLPHDLDSDAEARDFLLSLADPVPAGIAADPARAVWLVGRHPRTLELLVACFKLRAGQALEHLDDGPDLREYPPSQRIARMVLILQQRMSSGMLAVLRALAVLGVPATADDVTAVLPANEPHPSPDEVGELLNEALRLRLVSRYDVGFSLPFAEAQEIIRIWRDLDDGAGHEWLLDRVADHLNLTKGDARPTRVENLGRHLREIAIRLELGDYEECIPLMDDLDRKYLAAWGHSHILVPWRRRLLEWAPHSHWWRQSLSWMVSGALEVEEFAEARRLLSLVPVPTSASVTARGPAEAQQAVADEAFLLRLQATTALREGRIHEARGYYERARLHAVARDQETTAVIGLAECASELGDTELAAKFLEDAQRLLPEDPRSEHRSEMCDLLLKRAELARLVGRYDDARLLIAGAQKASGADLPMIRVRCLELLAAVKLEESLDARDPGRLVGEAVDAAQQASDLASQTGLSRLRRNSLTLLTAAHLRRLAYLPDEVESLDAARAAAVAAARLERSRRALLGYVALGMVFVRDRRLPGSEHRARDAFYRALASAEQFAEDDGRPYWVWDMKGLAHAGLHLCRVDGAAQQAVDAYGCARRVAPAPGAARRAEVFLITMSADCTETVIEAILTAVRGPRVPASSSAAAPEGTASPPG